MRVILIDWSDLLMSLFFSIEVYLELRNIERSTINRRVVYWALVFITTVNLC